jgi:hypothetical protein
LDSDETEINQIQWKIIQYQLMLVIKCNVFRLKSTWRRCKWNEKQSKVMEYFMLSWYFGDFDGWVDFEANDCIRTLESLNVILYSQTQDLQMECCLIENVAQMVATIPRMIDINWNIIKHWQNWWLKWIHFWLKDTC